MPSVVDIVPVGRQFAIVIEKDLPDQVKSILSARGVHVAMGAFISGGIANSIAAADLKRGEIYLVDTQGFAWKFVASPDKESRWEHEVTDDVATMKKWREGTA